MPKQESKQNQHVPIHNQRSTSIDKEKQKEAFDRKVKTLRMDMAITFGTAEGKRVLKWLKDECGWGKSVVGGNPALGMDVAQGTIYNSARLNVYLELRSLVPHSILAEVEYESISEVLE